MFQEYRCHRPLHISSWCQAQPQPKSKLFLNESLKIKDQHALLFLLSFFYFINISDLLLDFTLKNWVPQKAWVDSHK